MNTVEIVLDDTREGIVVNEIRLQREGGAPIVFQTYDNLRAKEMLEIGNLHDSTATVLVTTKEDN